MYRYFLTVLLAFVLAFPALRAQDSVRTEVTQVVLNEETVELTVSRTEPFYIGALSHIFYVGSESFSLCKYKSGIGASHITFFIPEEDFEALEEGAQMALSYGPATLNEEGEPQFTDIPERYWDLGTFSKELLSE